MKIRHIFMTVILAMTILFSSCNSNKNDSVLKNTSEKIRGTNDNVSDFLSLHKDREPGYDDEVCYNITPQNILENSDFRIFKYEKIGASFLLYDNEIFPIGECFGAYGVTNAKIYDINKDGEDELYFTFSWGTGMYRSQVGYFDPKQKEIIILDYSYVHHDMTIVSNNNGLSLYKAEITETESFANFNIKPTDTHVADIVFENNSITLSFPEQ